MSKHADYWKAVGAAEEREMIAAQFEEQEQFLRELKKKAGSLKVRDLEEMWECRRIGKFHREKAQELRAKAAKIEGSKNHDIR